MARLSDALVVGTEAIRPVPFIVDRVRDEHGKSKPIYEARPMLSLRVYYENTRSKGERNVLIEPNQDVHMFDVVSLEYQYDTGIYKFVRCAAVSDTQHCSDAFNVVPIIRDGTFWEISR